MIIKVKTLVFCENRMTEYGDVHVMFHVICLFVVLVISHSGFEGMILLLSVPVPGHCISFTLQN